ncbi:MAG: discoidin domain-containing protein [Clostridia bacterium]|nr:discoidin domain-containing protein [Clostridia bacterium]
MTLRKLIAYFLLITCIMSIISPGAFAAQSDPKFFISENFDGRATGSSPDFVAKTGKNVYIKEVIFGEDKALFMKTLKKSAGVTVGFESSSSEFVLSFDLGIDKNIPEGYVAVKSSSSSVKALIVESTPNRASLTTYDYKEVGGIVPGKNVHIDMAFNMVSKKYSVYVNGSIAVSDWFIKGTVPTSIQSVEFNFNGTSSEIPAEIYLNNLYAYSGNSVLDKAKLPKTPYNAEAGEFTEVPEDAVGNKIYLNRTFDEGTGDFAGLRVVVSNNNKIAVSEEHNGNKYLSVNRYAPDDCLFLASPEDNGSEKMMLEFDVSTNSPGDIPIYIRDSSNTSLTLARLDAAGQLMFNGTTLLAKLRPGKWVNIVCALDFETKKVSIFADGREIIKNQGFPAKIINFNNLRVQPSSADSVNINFDNLKIYDGTQVRDLTKTEEFEQSELKSIMPDYKDAVVKLTGKVALHVNGGTIFAKGKRSKLDTPAQIKNGRTLVPVRAVAESFDLNVDWDPDTQKVTVGDNIEMTIGSNIMKVGSKEITLDAAPEVQNGRTLLPLRALCEEALNKKVFWDDHGIIIVSDEEVKLNGVEIINISDYMIYDMPSKEEIISLFESTSKGVHPRVGVTANTFKNIKEQYDAGGIMKKWGDDIIFKADSYLKQPLPVMNKSKTNQELLLIPQAMKDRIEDLSVAYYITGNMDYVNRVYAELENASKFPDWNTEHYLNTAEYITAFAVGYDWLYNLWTDEQKKAISEALYKKGLTNSYANYYGIGGADNSGDWATTNTNWNLVCNGGTICGAVALMDDYPDIAADCISNALKGMPKALIGYYPSGVWTEGLGYWEFATEFLARTSESLFYSFGSDFNITKATGFEQTYEFPIHVNGYAAYNNYNDVGETSLFTSPTMFWLANKFNESGVAVVRKNIMDQKNTKACAIDMIYCNASQLEAENTFPRDKYLSGDELVSMRTSWEDGAGTYLSFHGGYAHVNHGHVDSGTFVIDMLGERIASDLGAESYNHPMYFNGNNRYKMYRARPEGHNMVVINPDETEGISLTSFSTVEKLEFKNRGVYSVLNLDDAYKAYTSGYKRGYKLEDDRRSAVVRDEINLLRQSKGYWFMHTKADIEIVDKTTAVLTKNGKKFLVRFATNASDFTLKEMKAEPLSSSPVVENQIDNTAQGYTKLALEFSASGSMYIEMKVIPYDDPASTLPLTNVPIADWTIPDGEMSVLPKPDMIYYNGIPITDFNPNEQSYTINIPHGEGVPVFTADTSSENYVEVTNAENIDGVAEIKVINKNNSQLYTKYYVSFREILVKVGEIPGVTRHSVKNIIASSNPQPENMDVNILDGDLSTRWSAEGSGQWVVLDLGEAQKINAIGIATYNGKQRTLTYSVDISDDGINWKNILVNVTDLTEEIEFVNIPEVSARYVRLTGYGTSTGTWNSITEFATLYIE